MKKFRILFLLVILTSCGDWVSPDYCDKQYNTGDKVEIKNMDDCNCVVDYERSCTVNLICKDKNGSLREIEVFKDLIK